MTGESDTRRSRAGPLIAAVAGLVLAGVATWIVLSGEMPRGPDGRVATPPAVDRETVSARESPVRVRVVPDDPARSRSVHPAGVIRVVGADGTSASARVYTTAEPHWSEDDALDMGRAGDDGLLDVEERDAEPLAFLWAFDYGRMAGPEAVTAEGQTLTLGPGATIRVHVQRPDGSPVVGAICRDSEWRDRGISGPEGHVVLSGYPRESKVSMFARVIGDLRTFGRTRVTTGADGTTTVVDVVVDATIGPFALVRFSGDVAAADGMLLLELSGGGERPHTEMLRGDVAPVLVSLRGRDTGPVSLTARVSGKRVARRILEDLAAGTTTPVELVLVDGGAPLRGRVVHADGSPAAEVYVNTTDRALRTSGSAQTDADGWFDVWPKWLGREILAVREAEACSPVVALHDDLEELVLTLGPGATIEGVVRDATTGRAIDGALVGLWFGYANWVTTTDGNGRYRFGGLPPGTFVAPAHIPSDRSSDTRADADRWSRARRAPDEQQIRDGIAYRIEGDETIRRDFVAIAELGATGLLRFSFPEGLPAPAEIELTHAWSETDRAPDENSTYLGTFEGAAEVRRFLKQGHHRFRATAPGLIGESEFIHVAGNAPLPDYVIVMQHVRRVMARIVGQDGVPLAQRDIEVTLTVVGPDGTRKAGDAETDATGMADLTDCAPSANRVDVPELFVVFTLDADGLYQADATDADANLQIPGREWARRLREDVTEPLVIDIPLVDPPAVIVSVVDAQGRPAPGVPIFWQSNGGDDDGYEATSDHSGMLTLARFDDSDILWLSARGAWIGEAELWVRAWESEALTMTVDRRRTVRLRVVLPDGTPVAHRTVGLGGPGWGWGGRADAGGEFDAEIPASETTLRVGVADHWTLGEVRVPAGATEAEVVVEATAPVTIRLEIPTAIRRPKFVSIFVGERRSRQLMSLPSAGPLENTIDLPPRALSLSVDIKHPRYAGAARYDGSSDVVTVKIEPIPLRIVVLELVDANDEPLAQRAVHVYSRSDRRELDEQLVTDAEGRVTLRVPPVEIAARLDVDGRETTDWSYDPEDEDEGPISVRLRPAR